MPGMGIGEGLFAEAAEVCLKHVAGFHKCLVKGIACVEIVGGVPAILLCKLHVIPKEFAICGVSAVLDDGLRTLTGIFAAEVGYTLLCHEDFD